MNKNMDQMNFLLWCLLAWFPIHFLLSLLKTKASKLPPGPFPIPVFGNLFQLGTKPHRSLAKLAAGHGPVMGLKLGQVTTVVISSSAMAKEVLQRQDSSFCNKTVVDIATGNDQNKLSVIWMPAASSHWRICRKILNSNIFSVARLEAKRHVREQKVDELVEYVTKCAKAGTAVNICEAGFVTALNMLSSLIFSMNFGDIESGSKFRELMCQLVVDAGTPNLADFFPVLKPIDPQGIRRRATGLMERMRNMFADITRKRLDMRKDCLAEYNDFLDSLLNICHDSAEEFEEAHIPDLLLDLFVAGTDTVSKTLEWAMAELLHNPDKWKKARAELNDVIGKGNHITDTHISKLSYLNAVLKETYRMHPVVPFLIPRRAMVDVELGGYKVPKDSQFFVNVFAIGRDPTVWENPDSFKPERFIGSNVDPKGQHFDLIPFSAGRRICPGLPLATRILPLMMGALVHHFQWLPGDGRKFEFMDIDDKFSFVLQKAKPLSVIPRIAETN